MSDDPYMSGPHGSPLPAGAGGRCAPCAKRGVRSVLLWSTCGRGWCPSCGAGGVPLVPVTWSPRKFLEIQKAYRRAAREHNEAVEDSRHWRFYLAPGSGPKSGHIVKEKRNDPPEAGELEWHMVPRPQASPKKGTGKPPGRPPKLTADDEKKLRRWVVKNPGWTVALMVDRLNDERADRPAVSARTVSARTVRRFLKREGLLKFLKPKKRPARRARRS